MSSIGILVLMGVVVNNGIVMIEHINNLRREGLSRADALVAGSRERLRPILMTMGTTVLGMLPLCFAGPQLGGDGPPYYPMARAIVGGLVFSTLVSLLFLPTIYAIFDAWITRTCALLLCAALARLVGCRSSWGPSPSTRGTAVRVRLPRCFQRPQSGGNGTPYDPVACAILCGLVCSTIFSLLLLPSR